MLKVFRFIAGAAFAGLLIYARLAVCIWQAIAGRFGMEFASPPPDWAFASADWRILNAASGWRGVMIDWLYQAALDYEGSMLSAEAFVCWFKRDPARALGDRRLIALALRGRYR